MTAQHPLTHAPFLWNMVSSLRQQVHQLQGLQNIYLSILHWFLPKSYSRIFAVFTCHVRLLKVKILRIAVVRNVFLYATEWLFRNSLYRKSYLKIKLWSLNWNRYNIGIHYTETSKMAREISNGIHNYPQYIWTRQFKF